MPQDKDDDDEMMNSINNGVKKNINDFKENPQSNDDLFNQITERIQSIDPVLIKTRWQDYVDDVPYYMADRLGKWLFDYIGKHNFNVPSIPRRRGNGSEDRMLDHFIIELKNIIIKRMREIELNYMNDKYFIVANEGGKVLVGEWGVKATDPIIMFQKIPEFLAAYSHQRIIVGYEEDGEVMMSRAKYWINSSLRRQYFCSTFDPNNENEVIDDRINIWRGFAVKPQEGDCELIKNHIFEILAGGNGKYYNYIIKWCAYIIQNPGKLAEVAIVFRGGQGTGKGTFGRLMKKIFGRHGKQFHQRGDIGGRFNGHHRGVCLGFFDEVVRPKDVSGASTFKAMLTEPTLNYEYKGVTQVEDYNYMKAIMSTNHQWAVPVEADDRRFAIFDANKNHQRDGEYFDSINRQIDNGGAEAFLYFLMNYELGDWHPRKDIPNTEAKDEQKSYSLDFEMGFIRDLLADGEIPYKIRYKGDSPLFIYTKSSWISEVSMTRYRRPIGWPETSKMLRGIGCIRKKSDRDTRVWLLPTHSEAIANFIKFSGHNPFGKDEFNDDEQAADYDENCVTDNFACGWSNIKIKSDDGNF